MILEVRFARLATPPLPEFQGQVGMHAPGEELAQNPGTEAGVHQTEHRLIAHIHIIAVRDKNLLASESHMLRFEEGLNATLLLQIVATPHVVIADEEVDLNATIR